MMNIKAPGTVNCVSIKLERNPETGLNPDEVMDFYGYLECAAFNRIAYPAVKRLEVACVHQ